MGKTYERIDDSIRTWMDRQKMFFVATAPRADDGRIVLMMCAFEGPPKIYRFHGVGDVVTPLDADFGELARLFDIPGVGIRAIIRIHVSRISDSCGYGVPNYEFQSDRQSMQNWVAKKGTAAMRDYQVEKNLESIDGIEAISEEEARAFVGADEDP